MCKLSYWRISSPKSKRDSGPTEYNQFSLARLETETPQLDLWRQLDVPVLQVILSGGSAEAWEAQSRGFPRYRNEWLCQR